MAKLNSLNNIIKFNSSFKTAVNLYLSLNKPEKYLDIFRQNLLLILWEII